MFFAPAGQCMERSGPVKFWREKTNTNNYAKVYGTADPKSDENSDETLNLVIITELVKLLECREDTIGKLVLVVVLQVPNDKNDEFRPKKCCF